uniref:SFRICE_006021 n=1 Tax=Spodoptera frugiperda TaxID=7108 RepID=A0A2H1WY72_SPOFR
MCSPIQCLPDYKEPPTYIPCIPIRGPSCLPCGMDNWTVRRPLIVHDSTFDYRPTSWPGMVLNNQDKKVRYQLINYERPGLWRLSTSAVLSSVQALLRRWIPRHNAVLALGQPPRPIAAFDKAVIQIGHR